MKTLSSDLAISVENLTKRYGDLTAVNGISFNVKRGEIFAFLGPNGAGKTTTVEILVGLRKPTSGGATVLGFDIAKDLKEIKKRIGVLPQSFNTYDRLTVKENIEYFAGMFDSRPDVDGLIKLVDLEDKKKEQFRNLSGGLKQRLGIAVALVNDPEVVFLDEPTSGLDPKARHGVWRLIEDLHAKGKTVFLTTHYMEEAEALADRVGIIHNGKIVALDEKDRLIAAHGKKNMLVLRKADQKAVSVIGKLGLKANYDEGDVTINLNDGVAVSDVMQALSAARVSYSELQLKRSSLEDVFLNLTGEELGKEETA
ncbi:ABC transporter ATP-binding protein [Candidatus Bathyarchaeota archaeon]|nr:ABC transporter ATP-binding protein [Candidatus Bathyarchaeota archaeon]